jgi:hypothetical protein
MSFRLVFVLFVLGEIIFSLRLMFEAPEGTDLRKTFPTDGGRSIGTLLLLHFRLNIN